MQLQCTRRAWRYSAKGTATPSKRYEDSPVELMHRVKEIRDGREEDDTGRRKKCNATEACLQIQHKSQHASRNVRN